MKRILIKVLLVLLAVGIRGQVAAQPAELVMWDYLANGHYDAYDYDGDGLSYKEEAELGTAEEKPDTDGDGYPDSYDDAPLDNPDAATDFDGDGLNTLQEHSLLTSDYEIDTDGDGLSDLTELDETGTDPTEWDTDGDGKSDGLEVVIMDDPLHTQEQCRDDDEDGLPLWKESQRGTNPNKVDTDVDGLSDGEEVNVTFTNPLERDTDGDGFDDGSERKSGTDPNNSKNFPQANL